MTKRTYFLAVASFIGVFAVVWEGSLTQGAIKRLDQATAQQCITHDWPATAHAIHIEWCEHNGYPTK